MSDFDEFWGDIVAPPVAEDPLQVLWDRLDAGDYVKGFVDDDGRPFLQLLTTEAYVRVESSGDNIARGLMRVEAEMSLLGTERVHATGVGVDLGACWTSLLAYVVAGGWPKHRTFHPECGPPGPPTSRLDEWLRTDGHIIEVHRSQGYFDVTLRVRRWTASTAEGREAAVGKIPNRQIVQLFDALADLTPPDMTPSYLAENAIGIFEFKFDGKDGERVSHRYESRRGDGRSVFLNVAIEEAFEGLAVEVPVIDALTDLEEDAISRRAEDTLETLNRIVANDYVELSSADVTTVPVDDSIVRWISLTAPPEPQD